MRTNALPSIDDIKLGSEIPCDYEVVAGDPCLHQRA